MSSDFSRYADVLLSSGSASLIDELGNANRLTSLELSRLLVYLAPLGGSGWATKLKIMGADVNFVDEEGQCALSQCVHGALVDERGRLGNSTFGTAIELLALGADPNSSYLSLFSVSRLALLHNRADFLVLFLLAGAELDRDEPDSQTSKTLREAIKLDTGHNRLEGERWPLLLLEILERQRVAPIS